MPSKNTKSRVSKTPAKKSSFKFRWWMGLGLVVLVAVIGIVVIRFSNAGSFIGSPRRVTIDRMQDAVNCKNTNNPTTACVFQTVRFPNSFTAPLRYKNNAASGAYTWQIQSSLNSDCGILSWNYADSKYGLVPVQVIGVGANMSPLTDITSSSGSVGLVWTPTTCN